MKPSTAWFLVAAAAAITYPPLCILPLIAAIIFIFKGE